MSLTSLLAPERRATDLGTRPLSASNILEWLGGNPSISGKRVTPESALTLGVVYTCCLIISDGVAGLPLPVYRRLGDREKERAVDHPAYPLLARRPNPWMNAYTLRQTLQSHLLLWGNAFAEIMRDSSGRLTGLFPLRPDRMKRPVLSTSGELLYPYTLPGGQPVDLPSSRILHLRGLSSDGIWGYSPVALQREAIALGMTAEEFASRFFNNMAAPSGVLQVKGQLSEEGAKRLATSWNTVHQGLENAQRIAVLEEGVEWHQVSMPLNDAQFIEMRQYERSEIAGWFRVPPHMIGDVEKTTSWGCLPGDTQIFTLGGPVPISDVKVGDSVWSLGEGGLVYGLVSAQRMTGIRPVLTVKTSSRTIRMTDNHRVPVWRYHGRSAGRRRGDAGWAMEWIRADAMRVGDYLATPHKLPEPVHPAEDADSRGPSLGLMEFLGLYLGDGSLDKGRVEIAHAVQTDYIDHYLEIIRSEFGVEPYTDARGTRTRFSASAAVTLIRSNLPGNAHTKRVPSWVFRLKHHLIAGFLRGFTDSDGCIQRGRIVYSSSNKAMLEDVRHLCMTIGVPVGRVVLAAKSGAVVIRGKTYTRTEKYHLALSQVDHNGIIGSNSPAKQANLSLTLDGKKRTYDDGWAGGLGVGRRPNLTPGSSFALHNLKLQRICSIEQESDLAVPVYDITVSGTQSFCADGVLVHNTGIEAQTIGFVQFTLRPWLVNWEQELSLNLLTEPEQRTYFIEHVIDGLLRGDTATRQSYYTAMLDRGVLSINDVRALENMNPVDGGDERFVQANMVPLSLVGAEPVNPAPTTGTNAFPLIPGRVITAAQTLAMLPSPVEERADNPRAHLRELYHPLIADAAARIVEREASAIRADGLATLEPRDATKFAAWLEQFHRDDLTPFIIRVAGPVVNAYAAATEREVLAELDIPALTESLAPFLKLYVEDMARSYVGRSQGQLEQQAREAIAAQEDPVEAVRERLDEWEETRPEKIADIESVRTGEAVAYTTYRHAGVQRLKWQTHGKNCSFCTRLNGKTVAISQPFAQDGEELEGEPGQPAMKMRGRKLHAPIHAKCNCSIGPA